QRERLRLRGQHQLEQEDGADVQRFLGLDEGATLRDVLRVIVEERVQPLVLDLELDRSACFSASVVFFGHDLPGRFMLGRVRGTVNELRGHLARLRSRVGLRALVWAGLLATLAVVLAFVPLFDVLGYDFSFALGLAAALAAVDVGQGLVALRGRPSDAPSLLRLVGTACGVAAALLILPVLISVANALRVRNCSFAVGFGFFVLLPLATVVYAAPAGVLAGVAVTRPRRGRMLAFAIPLVSLVWSLLRLYRDPPVFAFDPFGGYFPGPIYDEALRPPLTLLVFRLVNLVWIATAVAVALAAVGRGWNPRRWRFGIGAAAAPLLAASIVLYAMGGKLQFRVTRADLQ